MLEKYCQKMVKVSNVLKSHSSTLNSWKCCSVCVLCFEPIGFSSQFPRDPLCGCFCHFYTQSPSSLLIYEAWLPTHSDLYVHPLMTQMPLTSHGSHCIFPWRWGRICVDSFTLSPPVLLRTVEITKDHMRKAKDIFSELAIARESAIISCVWQTHSQAEEWGSFIVQRREGFRCAPVEAVGPGEA